MNSFPCAGPSECVEYDQSTGGKVSCVVNSVTLSFVHGVGSAAIALFPRSQRGARVRSHVRAYSRYTAGDGLHLDPTITC